jgi:RnfABCDGE-type electron transport complex B subunit
VFEQVIISITIMCGMGLFFAGVLAVAYRFLRVEEDPRLEPLRDLLPGNNCGACGQPGCAAFAEGLLVGSQVPAGCTVADPHSRELIASVLGVEVGAVERRIARLKCAGGRGHVAELASYKGIRSCRAAAVVDGGGHACAWGCLGLADCQRACTFDAIHMNEEALPVVTPAACTACGDCVDVCPQDLFVLVPESHKLFVQCNSPLAGEQATRACSVACDACGRCALDAPPGAIEMVGGLPVLYWDAPEPPNPQAAWRCPTDAIVWVEGQQFAEPEDQDAPPWRVYG